MRNLDDQLIARLKRRAARHGRSTEAEHREILRQALIGEGGWQAGGSALRKRAKLIAPELLARPESANVLWKKVRRNELLKEEALLAARLLQAAEIELLPARIYLRPHCECRLKSTTQRMIVCTLP